MTTCPLTNDSAVRTPGGTALQIRQCSEERCGWWDSEDGRCSMVTIARSTSKLANEVYCLEGTLRNFSNFDR